MKVVVTSEQAKKVVVALLGPADFFGEACLAAQPFRWATATAMTPTTVIRLDRAEMIDALHADSRFAEAFTAYLLARNSRVEADLVDQLFNWSEGVWPGSFCCWRISERTGGLSRSRRRSARRSSRK